MQKMTDIYEFDKLKKRFKKIGFDFFLGKDYSVLNPEYIEIGNSFRASHRFRIEAIDKYFNQEFSPVIKIGNNVTINTDVHIGCINNIIIGDNCLLASRIYITDHDHGETSLNSIMLAPAYRKLISKGPVIIKKNVWIGEGVSILSGVTIGENCIIATNSVVTKSIPDNMVVGGVPAKIIKNITI